MNDEVKLDNSFKLSFMTDVAKGMVYLCSVCMLGNISNETMGSIF